MISDRERRILVQIEQNLRWADPRLAQRFEAATGSEAGGRDWMSRVTDGPAVMVWMLLLLVSLILGLACAAVLFFFLAVFGAVYQAQAEDQRSL